MGHARAIAIDAMALMGEMLKAAQKATGGQPYQNKPTGSPGEPVGDTPPTLPEQGITKKQSSRAQALAMEAGRVWNRSRFACPIRLVRW